MRSAANSALALAILAVAGVSSAAARPLTADEAAIVRQSVRALLRDPESAQFDHLAAVENGAGDLVVCGFVNARNAFGGFPGAVPFSGKFEIIGALHRFSVVRIATRPADQPNLIAFCKTAGIW